MNHHVIPKADIDAARLAGDGMADALRLHADVLDRQEQPGMARVLRYRADRWDLARIRLTEPGDTDK
jgi:hypothetical protein